MGAAMEQTLIKALLGGDQTHCKPRSEQVAWLSLLRGEEADTGCAIRDSGH